MNRTTEIIDPEKEEQTEEDQVIQDLITDKPYCKLTNQEFQERSQYLFERNKSVQRRLLLPLSEIKKAKSLLPISQKRLFIFLFLI